MPYCPYCNKSVTEDSKFCSNCEANLESQDLSAREIPSIKSKLTSYRINQVIFGISGIICAGVAGVGQSCDNTGLLACGILLSIFCLLGVAFYEWRHQQLQNELNRD